MACLAIAAAAAVMTSPIAPFSAAAPGAKLPEGWRSVGLRHVARAEPALVKDSDTTVLQLRAAAAVGSAVWRLDADPAITPILSWRWKVDRVVRDADLALKEGDDYAARVYVTFDVPLAELPFSTRARIVIARVLFGSELPSAALCYVWDNRHPIGTSAWNPYSDRVRMVVLRNGAAHVGEWVGEQRDVAEDFRAAFGGSLPRVSGVAVSVDTDQTGDTVTAWFGDLALGPRR
ncbi:MAG TPA: DUF3047 domain-containing protein [Usitatibacter sp.]|nr:DUF3047 domain-containing protein [Usitatibacter sp.]